MGNQPIIDNQNTQQIGQNPTNQPPVPPVPDKPKVNFWMISTILFACLFFVVLGIYIFASSIRNKQESQISKPTEQTGTNSNIPSSNQDITLGTKFAYLKTATEDIRGSGDIIVSNFDGSYKQKIHAVPIYVGTYSSYDVSDKSEKLVYKSLIEKDQYGNEIEQE